MATQTDIGNRALQLLGTRTTVVSFTEQSNEAIQLSIAYGPVLNWCFGLANWNFSRTAFGLTIAKSLPASPGPWSQLYPAPPWRYSYTLPADFIRAIYITNNDLAAGLFLGEPKRFVLAFDTVAGVGQEVLLTNEAPVTMIYTANQPNPNIWPWHFERLMVIALAQTVCIALTGDKKLGDELHQMLEQQINIATQANMVEGLIIDDTTPELIQAIGINYPYRRMSPAPQTQSQPRKSPQDGNQ